MNNFNSNKIINFAVLILTLIIGFVVYLYPMRSISLGYDSWWIYFIQTSTKNVTFPFFYNKIGIEPGDIISSGIALFDYQGRISFLDWARWWLVSKYFANNPMIWRLVNVLAMSISLFYWVKIYRALSISKFSICIVYIILLTDPQSLWLDWNKAESSAFLFFSIASYYYLSQKKSEKYFSCVTLIIALLIKETFIIAVPFLIFIRTFKFNKFLGCGYRSRMSYYFNENKLLLTTGLLYLIAILIIVFFVNFEISYILDTGSMHVPDFINSMFKLIIPIQFHILINKIIIFFVLATFIIFYFSKNLVNKIYNYDFLISNETLNNISAKKLEIFLFPLFSIIALTIILFVFGNIERRYASPLNIIIITSSILLYSVFKYHASKSLKNKQIIEYLDFFVYLLLVFPFFILVSKVSFYLAVVLLLVFLICFLLFKRKKYIYFVIIILFVIPSLDRVIINITTSNDIYKSWDNINTEIITSIPQNSIIEINLSDQINLEQAVSLEVNTIFNDRGDITFFIDENKARQISTIRDYDLWHIQQFNVNKNIYSDNNHYIFSLEVSSSKKNITQGMIINKIFGRYNTYKNRYLYTIMKSN